MKIKTAGSLKVLEMLSYCRVEDVGGFFVEVFFVLLKHKSRFSSIMAAFIVDAGIEPSASPSLLKVSLFSSIPLCLHY